MYNIILQFICTFLFGVGLLFITLEARTKFDKTFFYFGISLCILSLMTALDIWIISQTHSINDALYWTKIFHILSCAFYTFSLWYFKHMSGMINPTFLKTWVFISTFFCFLFLTSKMMIIKNNEIIMTTLYNISFIPYTFLYITTFIVTNIKKIRRSSDLDKKIFTFHLLGIFTLCFCGILDLFVASLIGHHKLPISSFSVLGTLGFGVMSAMIFTERFLFILKDRENVYRNLKGAYKELETVSGLRQIGESTSMINHEIKNKMFIISGMASMLRRTEKLSEKGIEKVDSLEQTVTTLTNFSQDILELSKSQIIKNKNQLDICACMRKCVEINFRNQQDSFIWFNFDTPMYIYGDWDKLEQVFINIFGNAIEAASKEKLEIKIKTIARMGTLLITIEDNGIGCDKEQVEKIFNAFYTTKKGKMGTGLGMSISRTIILSHGGNMNAYSKNLQKNAGHGLILQIALPMYEAEEKPADEKHPIVVLKEGVPELQKLLKVFQNIKVNPYILQTADDLDEELAERVRIIGTPENINKTIQKFPLIRRLYLLSSYNNFLYVLPHLSSSKKAEPQLFSEEFVLSQLTS